ncbi:MAG TPA: PPOX class F420-dependent oxidoreductase [Candidatus Limnocylindrales bacterium]|jgi:PPOX class probable F420-dependent enzyme
MEPAQTLPSPAGPRLPDDIRAFLAAPRFATLATISPDGTPHQAVIWYAIDGDDLLINSRRERHWPRNLLQRPELSLAVQDEAEPNHWVGVKGRAELLRDGDAALADIQAMSRRYDDGDGAQFAGQDRVTYRVVVESTFEYGA